MTALTADLLRGLNPSSSADHAQRIGLPDEHCKGLGALEDALSGQTRKDLLIPRVVIQAFCDTPEIIEVIAKASRDRLMARARVAAELGGLRRAVITYQESSTPNLVIVESRLDKDAYLAQLDQLALVCDAGTRVMAIGHTNDIGFYRELTKRGISEYMLAPLGPVQLVEAISRVYGETNTAKIGKSYAFISAKGGAGSSTIAHNVGWTIAHHLDADVVVADMDMPFGTAGLNFNLDAQQGIDEAIKDSGRLDNVLLERLLTKFDDRLSLLTAPVALDRAYDLQESIMEPLLETARASVPFMIMDLPHIWTSWVRNVLFAADEIVLTAEPDLANLRNAKNIVSILRQARPHDPPPRLVLNRVGMHKRPEIKSGDFAKALQLEPIVCIPFNASLFGTAANKGQMVAEASPRAVASKAFLEISKKITGQRKQQKRYGKFLGFELFARKSK